MEELIIYTAEDGSLHGHIGVGTGRLSTCWSPAVCAHTTWDWITLWDGVAGCLSHKEDFAALELRLGDCCMKDFW